jgi:hypothetical protein
MPRWVIDHDPDSGRVEVTGVGVELHVVIERTGRLHEDRHEVRVRQVAGPGRDFTDGCAADALGEVLGLDPLVTPAGKDLPTAYLAPSRGPTVTSNSPPGPRGES